MSDDLEQRLRRELTNGRYDLDLDPETVLERVQAPARPARPARMALTMAAAALAVAGVVTVGFLVAGGDGSAPAPPAATARAVPGLPPGLAPAADVEATAKRSPALGVLPRGGTRTAFAGADDGGVWRVVMVADGDGEAGLPGAVVEVPADWQTNGTQILITYDRETTYVNAFRPDGRRWYIAVTGGSEADRLATMRRLLAANVTG